MVCPALAVPACYFAYKSYMLHIMFKAEIEHMWLHQNGEQVIAQTLDGVKHKLNIMDNGEYEIVDSKDGKIVFVMINSGREFYISTKNAKNMDFNLIDRLVRAICVETKRSTNVFHHILNKEIPINLRPLIFNLH